MNEKMFINKLKSCRELLLLQNTAITNILEKRLVFERLDVIIKANEKLKVYNLFWDWYFYNYIDSQVMELMRILDTDPKSKNMIRMLTSLEKGSNIDQNFFQQIRDSLKSPANMAGSIFDSLFDSLVPVLTMVELQRDQFLLTNAVSVGLVKNYRDWKVAHSDPQKWSKLELNLAKLNECIDLVHDKVCSYELFLNGTGYSGGLTPVITYDWESIFRIPWIDQGSS